MLVKDRVEGRILAAHVKNVAKVLHFFGGTDTAGDELLAFVHLLCQLILQRRNLPMNNTIYLKTFSSNSTQVHFVVELFHANGAKCQTFTKKLATIQ